MITNEELSTLLFDAIAEGAGISELTEIARKNALDNPIMITNESFRVIALCAEGEVDDPVWLQAKTYQGFSDDYIDIFKNSRNAEQVLKKKKTILYDVDLGKTMPRIITPIFYGNRILGLITLFGYQHPLRNTDLLQIRILGKALSVLMRQPMLSHTELDSTDYRLKNLLDNAGMLPRMDESRMFKKKYFAAAAIALPKDETAREYVPYLQNDLSSVSEDTRHCFLYGENLFLLLNFSSVKKRDALLAEIRRKLSSFGVTAGISLSFSSLQELSVFFRQAQKAGKIGEILENDCAVHEAEKLLPYLLFADYEQRDLSALVSMEYQKLAAYDQAHGTDVIRTVITWFETSLDIRATAEKLHLHRNTVSYRINSICRRMDIDVRDFKTLRAIQLSDLIARWLRKGSGAFA